jgi:hypothetical protein
MSNIFSNLIYFFSENPHYPKKTCNFCNKRIYLNDKNNYYFQILGLGKHNKKFICSSCLKKKYLK